MGGACGVIALRRAARAVQAGDAEIVACIAGDTANETSFRDLLATFSSFSRDAVYPYGAGGPNASFALIADAYMRATGATREDFGNLAVSQRANARRNPLALLRGELTLADYLAARPIAEPHHLFDCVMPCAGADGFLVMPEARARALNLPFLRVLGTIERHNAFPDDPVQLRGGWAMDRDALWAQAGIGPSDVQLVETYDDYPVISMLQFEGLGLCRAGRGARLRAPARLHHRGQPAAQYRRRPVVDGAGRRRRRLSWAWWRRCGNCSGEADGRQVAERAPCAGRAASA